jgi:hypothetical protein
MYVGALNAAIQMGAALEDSVQQYQTLLDKAVRRMEHDLFNGEVFHQKPDLGTLQATFMPTVQEETSAPLPPEALGLLQKEGPKYHYHTGCLSDGVLGAWLGEMCGLGDDTIDRRRSKAIC